MIPLIARRKEQPIFEQVASFYREQIMQHKMSSGEKFPSVRNLAMMLGISNNTVIRAYDQLIQEGYATTRPRRGLYVEKLDRLLVNNTATGAKPSKKSQPSLKYNLSPAAVDEKIFPLKKWRRLSQMALDSLHYQFANYEMKAGLKQELTKYLYRSRGVKTTPEQILVLSGTNISIAIASTLLKRKIKQIFFEDPGYAEGRQIFEECGYKIISIPMMKRMIDIGKLYEMKNALLYVTPSHQYPTGSIMPVQQRLRLIQWAAKTDSYIIEDDYDSELRYRGRPIPSLQAIDQHDRVIYLGTFSKLLMPSLRVSYLVLPSTFKRNETLSYFASTVPYHVQKTLALFIQQGLWERHVRKARKIYRIKYYEATRLLKNVFGDRVQFKVTHGGLYILMSVKSKKSSRWLADRAASAGIGLVSAENCYARLRPKFPVFFFGFGNLELDEIRSVVNLLKKVWFAELGS